MLVTGQKENTVYFSNLRKTDDAPDPESYRYCLYMRKLKGTEWKIEEYEIKNNIHFLHQVFDQLKAFHLRGFYHADVKNANSMTDSSTQTATLIDFGGFKRIWQKESICTPAFNAFRFNKETNRAPFWEKLEALIGTSPLKGDSLSDIEVRQTLADTKSKFETASQQVTSKSKFDANEPDTLISFYGIHLDMSSIVMLLVHIFKISTDAMTNKTIKHNQTLWLTCIQDCFKPKSVAALIANYTTQLSINSTDYKPFENFITSAEKVEIEWAPIYGIDYKELSDTIVDKEVQRRQREKSSVQDEKEGIAKQISTLTLEAEATAEGKKTKIKGNSLYHIFNTVGIENDPELKNKALFTIRSAFLTSATESQLKKLLELFFYIALINRKSNFLWRTRQHTTTFKNLVEIIAPTLKERDAMGGNFHVHQNEAILNRMIQIDGDEIQVRKIQPLIKGILNYPELKNITVDSLYNALNKHKPDEYSWIFDYKNHTGSADQILDCIKNTFICKDGEGKVIDDLSFNTFNKTNTFKSKFINAASTTKKLTVSAGPYVDETLNVIDSLCLSLNLTLPDNVSTQISTYVENLYP